MPAPLEELLDGLRLEDEEAFARACAELRERGPEVVLPLLSRIPLDEPGAEEGPHAEVFEALAADCLPAILAALESREESIRAAAALAVRKLVREPWHDLEFEEGTLVVKAPDVALAVPALIAHLSSDPSQVVRAECAVTLGKMGLSSQAVIDGLVAALEKGVEGVRVASAVALGKIGRQAFAATPSLTRATRDPCLEVRQSAALALGRIGSAARESVPALEALLSDPVSDVRVVAASALGKIGPEARRASSRLAVLLGVQEPLEVRYASALALGKIGPCEETREASVALLGALSDEQERVRSRVAQSLGEIEVASPGVIRALRDRLGDTQRVHDAAAWSLGRLGDREPEVVRRELALSLDEEPRVREAVRQILSRLPRAEGH